MEHDPIRMCELLVGLGDVEVLGVDDGADKPLGAVDQLALTRSQALKPAETGSFGVRG